MAALVTTGVAGCSAALPDTELDELGEADDAVVGKDSAAIKPGSPEEAAVLLVANDRALGEAQLKGEVLVTATAAKSLLAFRAGPTSDRADDQWFLTLAQLDTQKGTTKTFFSRMVTFAKNRGYVEPTALVAPDQALLEVPDNLGRPPTSNDVTVVKGFDGRTFEATLALVQGRLTNHVHPQNERLVRDTVAISHKAFTIAVGNLFAPDSPPQRFVNSLGASQISVLGLMGQITPVAIEARYADGRVEYYQRKTLDYERVEKPPQRLIMRTRISLEPAGVAVYYPAWSLTVLKQPTTTVIEGGGS